MRADAEDLEVVSGHQFALNLQTLAVGLSEGRGYWIARQDPAEHLAVVPQVLVHGVREGALSHGHPAPDAGRIEHDQLARIPDREGPQEDLVEQRENGRVDSQAKRQRDHGDSGEQRRPAQAAKREPQIGEHVRPFRKPGANRKRLT